MVCQGFVPSCQGCKGLARTGPQDGYGATLPP